MAKQDDSACDHSDAKAQQTMIGLGCHFDLHDFAKALKPFLKEACEEACKATFSAHLAALDSLALRMTLLEQLRAGVKDPPGSCNIDTVVNPSCQTQPDISSSTDSSISAGNNIPTVGQDEMFEWDDILHDDHLSSANLASSDTCMGNVALAQDGLGSDFKHIGKAEIPAGSGNLTTYLVNEYSDQSGFVYEYRLPSDDIIRIRELPMADGVHASTGCQLWPASMALGHFLQRERSLIEEQSVIELGAGCGFAGVVAARYASQCLITDADQETVLNLRSNLLTNRKFWLAGRREDALPQVLAETMRWEDVVESGWPLARRADVVIGSDIIYGSWGDLVAKVVQQILVPSGIVIMISATDRGGLDEFQSSMEDAGFDVDLSDVVFDGKRFLLYKCGPRSLMRLTRKHGAQLAP